MKLLHSSAEACVIGHGKICDFFINSSEKNSSAKYPFYFKDPFTLSYSVSNEENSDC